MQEVHVERLKKLDEIKKNVEESEKEIIFILQNLGWNSQHIRNKIFLRNPCPYDESHLIKPAKMKSHIENCKQGLRQYGDLDELFPNNCNQNTQTTVKIEQELCASIIAKAAENNPQFIKGIPNGVPDNRTIPLSYNQMITTFTTDERKALYEYTTSLAPPMQKIMEKSLILRNETDMYSDPHTASLEQSALIRDMKRRSTKYKVSTKAKTYTEVMRGVIDNLMSCYTDVSLESDKTKNKIEIETKNNVPDKNQYSESKNDDTLNDYSSNKRNKRSRNNDYEIERDRKYSNKKRKDY